MKKLYYIDIIFIIILALAVSTVLPSYVSYKQEQQLVDQTIVEEVATVQVTRTEKMEEKRNLEKFAFLLEDGIEYMEYTPVAEGKIAQQKAAYECLENELQVLFDMGVLPSAEFDIKNGQLYMAVNTNNPAQTLTVWQFLVIGGFGESYLITLDDATGSIISLRALWIANDMEAFYGAAYETVARFWGAYLGAGDMRVKDIRYAEPSVERLLARMGSSRKMILEFYGLTGEANLKDMLEKKQDSILTDTESIAEARTGTPYKERTGIELSISYYMEDETAVECVMEWDTNGYCFRRPESQE